MKTKPSPSATSAATRNGAPAAPRRAAAGSEFGPMMHDLHRRAVAQMRKQRRNQKREPNPPEPETDPQRLLHELQVHQIELELQNEELRKTRDEMEAARDKYSDLYDFAPVGYLTLDCEGTIAEANLTGASLLGVARAALVKRRFGAFVSPADRAAFAAFLQRVFKSKAREECDVRLLLNGTDAVNVRMRAIVSSTGQECRLAVSDITAHKQAEEKVRESEERFRVMANAMPQLAWIARPDGHIFWYNQRWYDYTGTTPRQMEGWGWQSVHDAGQLPEVLKRWKASLATGDPFDMTFPLRGANGGFRPFLTRVIPLKNAANRVVQWFGTNTDVAEQKLAEEKVRISEVRYRRLFEAAHDGVLLLDPVTRTITDANPFMTRLLGYPHGQLVGKELFEIGLLKNEAANQEMFRKLKLTHEVRYEDLPLESKGGRHQEVEVVANLYQEDGHAVIQCNIRDITARKQAEQELSEKARLLDLTHDAIIVRDVQGQIRYWNHGAEELYGWSRQEALGKISHRLLHTEYLTPLKQLIEVLHRTNRWTGELVHRTRDGRRVTVLVRKTLDRDRDGRPASVLENITDITARKQAEETQRRVEVLAASNQKLEQEIVRRQAVEESLRKSEQHQTQLLEQSRRLQEQLRQLSRQILTAQEEERLEISRELHDVIAQTLTGINIRLAALKKEAALDTRSLERNIARTQRLVEKSVDIVHQFARELRPTVLDDLGLIPALHAFMKSFTTRTGIRASLKAAARVEQLDLARRTVLFRVGQEALTNVARHAQASRVEVSLQKSPGSFCMRITDDGKSFDVERTLNGKGRKRLGLIGMRERLEMVGGSFDVESAPGNGTTIVAHIPLGKVARGGGWRSSLKPRLKIFVKRIA